MKIFILLACLWLTVSSCHHAGNGKPKESPADDPEPAKFFPVTAFFKGQLADVNERGLTPLKYTTVKGHTDSAWLKPGELQSACAEFLHPEIDTVNLVKLFSEKKFMDQSIDAITFTYDAVSSLPDSMPLVHWDVYIEPLSGKVKRIYLVKNNGADKTIQLTWIADKWCSINYIRDQPNGGSIIEKQEKITWEF